MCTCRDTHTHPLYTNNSCELLRNLCLVTFPNPVILSARDLLHNHTHVHTHKIVQCTFVDYICLSKRNSMRNRKNILIHWLFSQRPILEFILQWSKIVSQNGSSFLHLSKDVKLTEEMTLQKGLWSIGSKEL